MFKRFIHRQLQSLGASAAVGQEPTDAMRQVRSLEEARAAIEERGWSGTNGPEAAHLLELRKVCLAMRAQGMALEPNLLGRAACGLVLDRREAGRANTTFAANLQAFGIEPDVARWRLLRNGGAPLATLAGSLLPMLVGGSIVVENLFALDGLGHLAFRAVLEQDQLVLESLPKAAREPADPGA